MSLFSTDICKNRFIKWTYHWIY